MAGDEEEFGPIDVVVIGYPPGAPMTGEAVPMFLDQFAAQKARILGA